MMPEQASSQEAINNMMAYARKRQMALKKRKQARDKRKAHAKLVKKERKKNRQ